LRDLEPEWGALIEDCFKHPEDQSTLTRFFQSILPYLRGALAATYSHDPSIVQDALQSAFVKYMKIFRKGHKSGRLRLGYFIVVAKNCLIDELRRRKGQVPIDELAESELPIFQTVDINERNERILLVQYAMTHLDARCQGILESYYIDEIDAATIASRLGLGGESVHMAIKRCRDRLRSILSELTAGIPRSTVSSSRESR
jgi:RNA polymerase sigma factor (sigma-70 family)